MNNAPLILTLASAVIVAASLFRAIRARARRAEGVGLFKRLELAVPALANLVAGGLIAASLHLGAGLFFKGPILASITYLAIAILLASAIEFLAALFYPASGEPRGSALAAPLAAVLVAAGVFGFVHSLTSVPGGESAALALAYPVRGSWEVITGGPSALTNYHHNHPVSQNYAVDLVYLQGITEGQQVYAPIDGTIEEADNNREEGSPEPEGNLIILKTDSGTQIWLAHLRKNSVVVKKGDRVTRGQPLAQCGATGTASRAHLHIHAQRNGLPVPMVFGKTRKFLLRNDQFTSLDGN